MTTPQQKADEALAEDQARRRPAKKTAASTLKAQTTDLAIAPPGSKPAAGLVVDPNSASGFAIAAHREPLTPMEMLSKAVEAGATVEVLTGLMALQERWEALQARKAYDRAIGDAKAEIPVIKKNREVDFTTGRGRTNYRFEDLAEVVSTVDPILAKHGLNQRFRVTSKPGEQVSVTCIISHRDGHYEETTLSAERDDSGNKNSIQAIGSTVTYLQRYTLKAALGLAAAQDDDGRASAGNGDTPGVITLQQVQQIIEQCEETATDKEAFCAYFKIDAIVDLPVNKYSDAIGIFARKKQAAIAKKAPAEGDTFPGDRPMQMQGDRDV